jgi:sucrose-6-phosphate hydrolase SacC (GH32 family)
MTIQHSHVGWTKRPPHPVLGGDLGTCFEPTLMKRGETYTMWFSWRPKKSIAVVESRDGMHWSDPVILLGPNPRSGWEDDVNRQTVVVRDDGCRMWYTGQVFTGEREGRAVLGLATSQDGIHWQRFSDEPVLVPDAPWEQSAVMCPHVLWDEELGLYRMWYSGGEIYEPDAIGYATSPDGIHWTKHPDNPIFTPDHTCEWEQEKVTACQVLRHRGWHLMFYIGFRDVDHAQIGLARSRDGITGWQRHPANPIISPTENGWDHDAVYKPFALLDEAGGRWRLWYNGRRGSLEQIGLAVHEGEDLGFV